MYSIDLPHTQLHSTIQSHAVEDIIDNLLPFSLSWTMAIEVQNQSSQTNAILEAITYNKVNQCDSVQ